MIRHSKPAIDKKDIQATIKVFNSGLLSSSTVVRRLELSMAKFLGIKAALATNSGTSALHLALISLGLGRKDEVIIPSYVCTAVLNAINYVGAKPVVCDIEQDSFNLSHDAVKKNISKKTAVIILPHMFGLPASIGQFLEYDIPIIEDCAQALGATYKGKMVGSFGNLSIFSFYATKVITTLGYGGMVLSDSKKLITKIRNLIDYDERKDYIIRYNYNMSEPQAAFGLSQLDKLPEFIEKRIKIAGFYNENLYDAGLELPLFEDGAIFYRYVVCTKGKADKFIKKLNVLGIEAKKPVFKPLHRYLGLNKKNFPTTEYAFNSAVSLPIYPSLRAEEANFIVRSVKKTCENLL